MDLENTTSIRLQLLSAAPAAQHLSEALAIAHEKPGIQVRIPWVADNGSVPYTLSVQFPHEGAEPVWVLSAGLGAHARKIFAHGSGDVDLILSFLNSGLADGREPGLLADVGSRLWTQEPSPPVKRGTPYPSLVNSGKHTKDKGLKDLSFEKSTSRSAETRPSDLNSVFGNNVLVGDLLVKANLLTLAQLAEAMPIANATTLPLGRILVESGVLAESAVRAAVLAQSMIRDRILHFELAVKALKLVHEQDIVLGAALAKLGWISEYYEVTNKLGELLVDAGTITDEQLKSAFEVCFASGLPLGRVLVLRKAVPEVVAYTALSAQVQLREGKINRADALAAVRNASQMDTSIQGWMERDGYLEPNKKNTFRLGELLILAGIVSELDLLSAIEAGLALKIQIGQVLIKTGVINEPLLKQGLKLQEAVNSRLLSPVQAAEMLKEMRENAQAGPTAPPAGAGGEDLEPVMKALGADNNAQLKRTMQELLLERENLAFRLVSEQEEIKHRLARELHDTIIADLMMLKRYLSGDRKLTIQETIEIVDDVVRQLRDICNDFVPKQLKEWGLEATLRDLLNRVSQRTGMRSAFHCAVDLKTLPDPVLLHIFRIVQECLNNIEKYANASQVKVTVERADEKSIRFLVEDNGQGFDSDAAKQASLNTPGGRGMGGMKERVQLLRCYFPTRFELQSKPGLGSLATLEIDLATRA